MSIVQVIRPEEVRSVAGGSGIQGREGVIYTTLRNGSTLARTYLWDGEKHVELASAASQALVSGAGNRPRHGGSMMWLGDSLTDQSTSPLAEDRGLCLFTPAPAYAAINAAGGFVRYTNAAEGCPIGAGTLRYFVAEKAWSWQAFGQTEGPRTPAANAAWVALESGSPGATLFLALVQRFAPAADAQDTVSVAGTPVRVRSSLSTHAGWASVLAGHAFDREYNFGVSGIKAVEIDAASAQWAAVQTAITAIHLGTNGSATIAEADAELAAMDRIIRARLAVGSYVIVGSLFPYNGISVDQRGARSYYQTKLEKLCRDLGVEHWSAWQMLAAPTASDASFRTDVVVSDDGLHLNTAGCLIAAQDGLLPLLQKIATAPTDTSMAGVQYAAGTAPHGNLLTNGLFAGTSGTKGARTTGDVPSSWSLTQFGGAALACVGTAPASASPVPRGDGLPGNWFRIAVNNATGVDGEYASLYQSAFIADANFSEGDWLVLEGEFQLAGSGIRTLAISGYRAYPVHSTVSRMLESLAGRTIRTRFRSKPVRVAAGFTQMQVRVELAMKAGGSATLDLGPLRFYKVPSPVAA